MDTITHGLFGYNMYKSLDKEEKNKKERQALFFTALVSNEIPDIDVIANMTEMGQLMSQMWHRGITHSIFLVPFWALLIYLCCRWFFQTTDIRLYYYALLGVFIHDTIDVFNAWGTGYYEPISNLRVTIGTIPIVDGVFWLIFIIGLIYSRKKTIPHSRRIFRMVALLMFVHFVIQTSQGLYLEQQAKKQYQQVELAATLIPWRFAVIGKNGSEVEISERSIFTQSKPIVKFTSKEKADLTRLWQENPKAKVLYQWSPFVVVIDNAQQLGIFDPRFYSNGFFLKEVINK